MQPELKKLISVFLGVALVASIVSFSFMQSAALGTGSNQERTANSSAGIKNAFADISLVTPPWRTQSALAAKNDFIITSNLTDSYSRILTQELSTAATKNGIVNESALLTAAKKIESHVFEDIVIASSEIKVNPQASLEDAAAYMEKIRSVGYAVTYESVPKNFGSAKSNTEQIAVVLNFFKKKHEEVAALNVPPALVPVHKAFLSFLIGQEKFYGSLIDDKDPLKTIFVIQNKDQLIDHYVASLTNELEKVAPAIKVSYLDNPEKQEKGGLLSLFTPQVAHADIDPATLAATIAQTALDVANWAKQLAKNIKDEIHQAWIQTAWIRDWVQKQLEWAEKKATELLKNVLVQLFVVASISWINGDGAPQFVTNWRSYADSAISLGINKGFADVSNDVCGTFGPTMMQQLNGSFNTYYMPSNCQQNSVGRALSKFRDNSFFDGGWGAYGTAISPQGNYFSNYTNYASRISGSADKEVQSKINEVISSGGFLPTRNCPEAVEPVDPANPNQNQSSADGSDQQSIAPQGDGSCPDGSEPQATTPGITFRAALEKSVGAPIDRIVNAENLISLSFTLVNGVMSKLQSSGSKGLTGLRDTGSMQVTNPTQNINLADVCSSYATGTPQHQSCMGGVAGADLVQIELDNQVASTTASTEDGDSVQNLKTTAQNIASNKIDIGLSSDQILSDIKELTVETINLDGSVGRSLFEKVVNACSNLATSNPDRARIEEVANTRGDLGILNTKVPEANNINKDLMAADLTILIQSNDLTQIRTLYTQFTTNYGTLASSSELLALTANRKGQVATVKSQAQKNLDNPCATPIQRITPAILVNP